MNILRATILKRCMVIGILAMFSGFVLASYDFNLVRFLLGLPEQQPLLSERLHDKNQFDALIHYPYRAGEQRIVEILENYLNVEIGMSGNEVIKIMGKPDYVNSLAPLFQRVRGWSWTYNLAKQHPNSPGFYDKNITISFDVFGKVDHIRRDDTLGTSNKVATEDTESFKNKQWVEQLEKRKVH